MPDRTNRLATRMATHTTERRKALLDSPSLDSDIISNSVLPSTLSEDIDNNGSGWVLFSPQVLAEEEYSVAAQPQGSAMENIEPLDLTQTSFTQQEDASQSQSWELPSHNGTGAFSTPMSSRLALFERVNAWRIEQSEMLVEDGNNLTAPRRRAFNGWEKLKANTVKALENYFTWDEETIEALFSKEFPKPQSTNSTSTSTSISGTNGLLPDKPELYTRDHLSRAKKYGPAGWEERILHNTVHRNNRTYEPSIIVSMLSKLLAWSKLHDPAPRSNSHPLLSRRCSLGSVFDNADRSYHMGAIQGSIATVTSTMSAAAPWSETWDSGTSTSIGVAGA